MTNYAVRIHTPGDVTALRYESVPMPEPGPKELRIRHEAIGLNYIDIYHRDGTYPLPEYPAIAGVEGVGVVDACGAETEFFRVGDRVAYVGGPPGAYAQYRVLPERWALSVPDALSSAHVAGVLLKGMTAQMLLRQVFGLQPDASVLVHAASGGVGSVLCQWAKHIGARVIGTVGSEEKAAQARTHGCDAVIVYTRESVPERVREFTEGAGVNVVYDGVGQATFADSLQCLMPMGLMVSYGQASGAVPALDVLELMRGGSLFLTRPTLWDYTRDHAAYIGMAGEVFKLLLEGTLRITIGQTFYLRDVARAHTALQTRSTHGATVLLPE